jgi:hypothetical protein
MVSLDKERKTRLETCTQASAFVFVLYWCWWALQTTRAFYGCVLWHSHAWWDSIHYNLDIPNSFLAYSLNLGVTMVWHQYIFFTAWIETPINVIFGSSKYHCLAASSLFPAGLYSLKDGTSDFLLCLDSEWLPKSASSVDISMCFSICLIRLAT